MIIAEIQDPQRNAHNYYIDLFRFVLMAWIVLFHYTVQYNAIVPYKFFYFPFTFENGGTIGVSLFFMVSGFFMTKALMIAEHGFREYGKYVVRRYLRLWIPYVFACIFIYTWFFFLPVEGRTVDFKTLLANVGCIIHPGYNRVDNAHWFLADLLVVQLLLGFVLFIKNEKYRRIIFYCVFVIVMVSQIIPPPLLSGFSKELFEVLFGVQLCMMTKDKDPISIVLSLIGLGVLFYLSLELFIFSLVFLVLVFIGNKYPLPSSIKKLQLVLQFAASISFCWYLVHQNIGYSIMYYVLPYGTTNEFWLLVPMSITMLIALGIYVLDKQLNKVINKKISFLKK